MKNLVNPNNPNATAFESSSALLSLYGRGVAKGYAIGRAVVMGAAALEVPHYRLASELIAAEKVRLTEALSSTRLELEDLSKSLPQDAPIELAAVLQVHVMLLADPLLTEDTLRLIEDRHYNAEWALTSQGQLLAEQFSSIDDEYLRERGADVRQVVERVLHTLVGTRSLASLDQVRNTTEPLIVVARDISPADMIRLRGAQFAGFVTDLGGPTSHTAIVARSMGVPAVVAVGLSRQTIRDGDLLILDGEQGVVWVNPSSQQIKDYQELAKRYVEARAALISIKDVSSQTLDGIHVGLYANIELHDEVGLAMANGAQGIGLFRSEFLFMGRQDLPSEQEQFEAYKHVVHAMSGQPVTIRTLDIGADKTLDGENTVAANPALGLRAIRYCLARPEMFMTQIRALLRASAFGRVRILIPMITNMQEVRAAQHMIRAAQSELSAQSIAFEPNIEIGGMVEVPAMAIAIEPFAQALDFLSIGTNDLIQYTLGIDRTDADVSSLYDPLHPAVLRLIASTINAGVRFNKSVSLCGEMAGDAGLTKLLLGLGLTEFSMQPRQILDVKGMVLQAHTNALRTAIATSLNRGFPVDLATLN
jgi:phosphoenolpyruvate-protein phosphotransferase (PTS system enzyme I)